jgi:hypothetical protein
MERTITLSIEKAKEFYAKGGEFRDLALGAYTEEELTKIDLPKTWEEFCKNYPVREGESWLSDEDGIMQCTYSHIRENKNWIPSVKSAEAHLAMIQLEQLRDCYRQGWLPNINLGTPKYYIYIDSAGIDVGTLYYESRFLTFQDKDTAIKFSTRFADLIKKAGDLI